jgi:hypothetical protein
MKKTATRKKVASETNSVYFLKILVFFILGSIWVKYNGIVVFPIGLVVGLGLSAHDHFAIDRKVEYAVLIVSALLALATGNIVFVVV